VIGKRAASDRAASVRSCAIAFVSAEPRPRASVTGRDRRNAQPTRALPIAIVKRLFFVAEDI
jgi:hypothetical protein